MSYQGTEDTVLVFEAINKKKEQETKFLSSHRNLTLLAFGVINEVRSSRPEVPCKKGVLRNFTKFTGKHMCHRLF